MISRGFSRREKGGHHDRGADERYGRREGFRTKFLWMMTTTIAIGGLIVAMIKI